MRDQIVMSKNNGACAVAVPLFRWHVEHELTKLAGYSLSLTNAKPLAYVIDCGEACSLVNAEFAEANLEFIGDL